LSEQIKQGNNEVILQMWQQVEPELVVRLLGKYEYTSFRFLEIVQIYVLLPQYRIILNLEIAYALLQSLFL
jgi:hypothetical protein